ncbi:E3 ubiquitin-protein ligase SINAT5-like [Pyrus communis]|uniref:E3 ubiquitin-protein ligase SINAT5-like n=1 Tax=Pyrus communis TaxID=23211 RepID=UPI0035C12797
MEEDSFVDSLTTYDGIDEGEDTYHCSRRSCHRRRRFLAPAKSNNRALSPATTVRELLECPVCSKSMFPPIHQCPNGHTLCSICKLTVNRCPACREKLGDIRCLALEKVAESLELPCKYCSLGCMEIFPYYIKLRHEAHCNYRPYSCPYPGSDECSEVGDVPFLVDHLREDHKVDLHVGPTFNHLYVKSNRLEVECAARMLMVFNCYNKYFCLHFEAFHLGIAPVYIAFLRFMGDAAEARSFSYRLEVGSNGRKLIWEGTPRSIRDSHQKVRNSHDGLIIQRNMALFFSGGDRKELKLRISGRIWKDNGN